MTKDYLSRKDRKRFCLTYLSGKTTLVLSLMLFLFVLGNNTINSAENTIKVTGSEGIAQSPITITGKVVDKTGEPLIGVSVTVKNEKTGTITELDGSYKINVKNTDAILVFSYLGYLNQEIKVGNKNTINVTLDENTKMLDEVVVVGYGTMKKSDLSGAVVQVKADELLAGNPSSSINQALQGRLAGVSVTQDDGAPGGGINLQVRGINSFSTDSQPLYIVDGIPFVPPTSPQSAENRDNSVEPTGNALSFINPHDIASIEVLKDASATAIYGSRGANGVVIITTKQGEKGKPKIEFTTNISISSLRKKVEVLDAYHYARYRNEQQDNGAFYDGGSFTQYTYPTPGIWKYTTNNGTVVNGKYTPSPEDFLSPGWYSGTDPAGGVWNQWVEGTDWQDQIFQTGISQEYNLQISGANDRGNYSFSGNYTTQDGIIENTGFDRYTLRANIGQKITRNITVGLNLNYTNSVTDFAKGNSLDYSILRSALLYPSTIYYGDYSQSEDLLWLSANPRTYVESAKNELASSNIFASSYLSVNLMKGLTFRQNLGLNNFFNERSTYYNRDTGEGRLGTTNGRGGWSDNRRSHTTTESMLTFNKVFNKIHSLNVVGAVTSEQTMLTEKAMSASQFPTDFTENYDMGAALLPDALKSNRTRSRLFSVLGRTNYVLNNKYIFTASFRRDGSSKFHSAKFKYANFASGAFAWRASEEEFIKNLNIFDNLKLRLSFGQTGNQGIQDYQTMYTLKVSNYPIGGGQTSGFAGDHVYNENLKWETTDQYNAGIDFGFLNNRLSMTVDYYHKKTKDLLQNVKIPPSSGYGYRLVNFGTVTNEGLEFTVAYDILTGNPFKWSVNGNLSFNKNRISDLNADQFSNRLWYKADNVFIQRNGMPIGAIYGYVEDGFYDNEAEVRANPTYANADAATVKSMIGEIKYRENMDIIGDTNPDYTFGITNNFSWKDFTFSFFIQGVQGNDIFNGNLMNVTLYNTTNIPTAVYDGRWTSDTRETATWPKATNQPKRTWLISDRYIEDGSYIRLKNINIGYTFQKPKFCKDINSINVYASASNLLTITNYSWYDPDVNAFGSDPARRGVDIYSYPASRTFSFGLKVQF